MGLRGEGEVRLPLIMGVSAYDEGLLVSLDKTVEEYWGYKEA